MPASGSEAGWQPVDVMSSPTTPRAVCQLCRTDSADGAAEPLLFRPSVELAWRARPALDCHRKSVRSGKAAAGEVAHRAAHAQQCPLAGLFALAEQRVVLGVRMVAGWLCWGSRVRARRFVQTRWRDFMGYKKIGPSDKTAFEHIDCTETLDCDPPELAWVRYQVRTATGKGDKPQEIQQSAETFSLWAAAVQEVRSRPPALPPAATQHGCTLRQSASQATPCGCWAVPAAAPLAECCRTACSRQRRFGCRAGRLLACRRDCGAL